jgi:hypothetical protein
MRADPSPDHPFPKHPGPSPPGRFGSPASVGTDTPFVPPAFPRFASRPIFLRAPVRVPVPLVLPG